MVAKILAFNHSELFRQHYNVGGIAVEFLLRAMRTGLNLFSILFGLWLFPGISESPSLFVGVLLEAGES